MNEIQNENNRSDDKKRISADIKRYLIPVLGVSLAAVTLCGIGYLYFSPAPAEKVTVAVNDTADAEAEKTAEEAAAEAFDALTPLTPPSETDKPKIVVAPEEPSLVETTPIETAQTDYSRIEIPETAQPSVQPKPKAETPAPKPVVQFKPVRSVHWLMPNGLNKCLPITTFVQSSKPATLTEEHGTVFLSAHTLPKMKPIVSNRPFRP